VPGPGGPCSEIYYDRGPEYGRDGGPVADEDRFLEVWNLVFMQDQLSKVRAKDDFDIEGPLPSKNVDTGMGLERMASILQGVDNLYEIDTTWKILDRAAELTEQSYGRDHRAVARDDVHRAGTHGADARHPPVIHPPRYPAVEVRRADRVRELTHRIRGEQGWQLQE